jgi:hypothetical protein
VDDVDFLNSKFIGRFVLLIASLGLVPAAWCQDMALASAPAATSQDAGRFSAALEDWTTPSVKKDALQPIAPLLADTEDHDGYVVQLIQVQWRPADPIDLYVIRPKGVAKPPVILWLYGYPAQTEQFQDEDFQKLSTKGGFAVVGFLSALTGHRFHDRPMSMWFVSELQESLATSAHDVQRVLDYLATRDDLDTSRVGLFGQGSGASIGILAAAVDPRIQVLDTLDPWGDWPEWTKKSTLIPEEERDFMTKPEFLRKVGPLDPLLWLPKLEGRSFRFQDSEFVKSTPLVCREKLRTVLPPSAVTVSYRTQEDFQAVADGGKLLEWIKGKLRKEPKPLAASKTN